MPILDDNLVDAIHIGHHEIFDITSITNMRDFHTDVRVKHHHLHLDVVSFVGRPRVRFAIVDADINCICLQEDRDGDGGDGNSWRWC